MPDFYYQTRNGIRVRVRKGKKKKTKAQIEKGKNRLKVKLGKRTRITVRGSIPRKEKELYGKGVVVIGSKSKSIKQKSGISLKRRDNEYVIRTRIGKVKGGIAGGVRKRHKTEIISDFSVMYPLLASL